MTSLFPLFDTLYEETKKRTLTMTDEYNKLLHDTLNSLQIEQMEQVVLIIVHFNLAVLKQDPFRPDMITAKTRAIKMPYSMKCGVGGKGLSFSVDDMPHQLKFILGEYCLLNN